MKRSVSGFNLMIHSLEHSKNSLCYIGIMKNKNIKGFGKCMVVFTDKTIKNILIVEN